MNPVLCLGDICVDLIIPYAAALKAKSGELLPNRSTDAQPVEGGSVANTAVTLARLRIPVQFCGTCGSDAYGQMLQNGLVREGDYYKLASYADNGFYDAWEVVNKEESLALVTYIKVMARPYTRSNVIKMRGLDPKRRYMVSCDKKILGLDHNEEDAAGDSYKPLVLHGDTLMNAGIMINENAEEMKGDFRSALIEISAV